MIKFPLPLLGFAAYSGTGKTTLLSKIIPLLTQKAYRIAVIKHTHHTIDIDKPGKDSFVLRESGAEQIVIASPMQTAIIIEHAEQRKEASLDDALGNLHTDSLDLVLVEGFKHASFAKIELHRKSLGKPYIYPDDPDIIAIAHDQKADIEDNIIKLDINKPQQIADYIELNIIKQNLSSPNISN